MNMRNSILKSFKTVNFLGIKVTLLWWYFFVTWHPFLHFNSGTFCTLVKEVSRCKDQNTTSNTMAQAYSTFMYSRCKCKNKKNWPLLKNLVMSTARGVYQSCKQLPPCQGNARNVYVSDLIIWALHLNLLTTWCAKNGKYSLCTAVHFVFTYFNCMLSARWQPCECISLRNLQK